MNKLCKLGKWLWESLSEVEGYWYCSICGESKQTN